MTKRDALVVLRLRRHGIVNPILTLRAARETKLPVDVACGFLEQETAGGHNEFGHDLSIFRGAGKVTKQKYLKYRRLRDAVPGLRRMQGVGPMQLTWFAFQDQADAQGGCWKVYPNILVGFTIAMRNIRRHGLHRGIAAYNGSGPAAERYAVSVMAKANRWRKVIDAPIFRPPTIAGTHFTWAEARSHDGKAVPLRLRPNAIRQAKKMEQLRAAINRERVRRGWKPTGISTLSWYRSPEQNRRVGGAAKSRHLNADACDIALAEVKRLCPWKGGRDDFDRIAGKVFWNGGFGTYPGGNRHVDSRGWFARWSSWTPGR